MEEPNDSAPRGAFLLMLIYLLLVAVLWTNVYLQLWGRG